VSRTRDSNPAVLSFLNGGGRGGGGSPHPNEWPFPDGTGAGTGADGGTCARRGVVWAGDGGGGGMWCASGWGVASVRARARSRGRTVSASGSSGGNGCCDGNPADCTTPWCAWRTSGPCWAGVAGGYGTASPGTGGAVGGKSTRSGNGSAATAWGTTSARVFSAPPTGGGAVKSTGRGSWGAAGYRRPPASLLADRREPSLRPGGVWRTSWWKDTRRRLPVDGRPSRSFSLAGACVGCRPWGVRTGRTRAPPSTDRRDALLSVDRDGVTASVDQSEEPLSLDPWGEAATDRARLRLPGIDRRGVTTSPPNACSLAGSAAAVRVRPSRRVLDVDERVDARDSRDLLRNMGATPCGSAPPCAAAPQDQKTRGR